MSSRGEVSLQEIMSLVETAREYLGPMWVKKNMKAAANLPIKGIVNRKQLTNVHPLGLLFKEVEKTQETLQKGKPLSNAATLLMVAGLARNLKSLEIADGFDLLIDYLKKPLLYSDTALLTEVSAHWLKLGYELKIEADNEKLVATARKDEYTFQLQVASYTFLPGYSAPDSSKVVIPGNFIYSSWWEAWTSEAIGTACSSNPEVESIIADMELQPADVGRVCYLDLPLYAAKEDFLPILAAAANRLQTATTVSAVILCLPQHLPHLYVRHTLPVFAEKCSNPLPKSLLNTLSY